MTFSKLFLSLLCATALAACSTESTKKKDVLVNNDKDYEQVGNFQVSSFKVTHSSLTQFVYGLPKAKVFTFEACMTDQTGEAIKHPNLRFTISDGTSSQEALTDRKGCLTWSEVHTYAHLYSESYFNISRVVTSLNYYRGFVVVKAAFNPWMDGGSALVDTRYNALPAHATVSDVGPLSIKGAHLRSHSGALGISVNLKSASFKFFGLDYDNYEVSPSLDLMVAHKYQVRLSPTVLRKGLSKPVISEVLNAGRMKAVIVILREDSKQATQFSLKNVIASTEIEDELYNGELALNMSIQFPTVVDITSRTVILITLVPLEELEGLPSMNFSGPLSPGTMGTPELRPVGSDAVELHKLFQDKQAQARKASLDPIKNFAKASGFKPLASLNLTTSSRFTENDFKNAVEKFIAKPNNNPDTFLKIDMKRTLCAAVYPNEPATRYYLGECLRFPDNYIEFRRLAFVEQLNSNKPIPEGLPVVDTLRMSHSMSLSDSTSSSVGVSTKLGLGWGLGFPLGTIGDGSFKFSVGGDFAYGRAWKSDNTSSSSVSRERSVTAEGNSFKLDVMTRYCFAAAAGPRMKDVSVKTSGVLHCMAQSQREERIETYYLITSKSGVDGSPFSDNASKNSSPWKMMIRGPQVKNLFATMLEKPGYQVVLQKAENQALEDFAGLNQEFPGLLSETYEQ